MGILGFLCPREPLYTGKPGKPVEAQGSLWKPRRSLWKPREAQEGPGIVLWAGYTRVEYTRRSAPGTPRIRPAPRSSAWLGQHPARGAPPCERSAVHKLMWTPVTGLEEEVPTPETRLAITPPASTPPVGLPCLSALTSSGSPDPVTPAPASWETVRDHAHLDTA